MGNVWIRVTQWDFYASMYQAYHRPEMREKLMELIQEILA